MMDALPLLLYSQWSYYMSLKGQISPQTHLMWKRKYVTCPIEAWMFWTDCVGGDGWIGITRSSHYVLGPICTRLILWLGSSGTPNTPDHSKSVDIFICLLSMYVGGPAKGFLSLEKRKKRLIDWLMDPCARRARMARHNVVFSFWLQQWYATLHGLDSSSGRVRKSRDCRYVLRVANV